MTRLLLVDYDSAVRDVLNRFFTKKNYSVLTAETGEKALVIIEKEQIDAVLLNIRMPGLIGLDTLTKIQAIQPELPVVIVSGQTDEEIANATLKAGAFDYVMEPVNFDYLERTICLKLFDKLI